MQKDVNYQARRMTSPSKSPDSVLAAGGGDPFPAGVILLVDGDQSRGLRLGGRLRAGGFLTVVRDPTLFSGIGPTGEVVDVALIQLGAEGENAIAQAQDVLGRDPSTEVIFFADRPCSEMTIAHALGINRIISVEALPDWLVASAVLLVRCVRARRALRDAQEDLPVIPPFVWSSTAQIGRLPVAEQKFREAFLRQLLIDTPNREAAARMAGVPYRTLCDMLRKLGIEDAGRGGSFRPSDPSPSGGRADAATKPPTG